MIPNVSGAAAPPRGHGGALQPAAQFSDGLRSAVIPPFKRSPSANHDCEGRIGHVKRYSSRFQKRIHVFTLPVARNEARNDETNAIKSAQADRR